MERGGRDSTYTRSRLDVVLAENKQLKKRAEAAERDNRELKISVYELSARLSAALARNEKLSRGAAGGAGPSSAAADRHLTDTLANGGILTEEVAAQVADLNRPVGAESSEGGEGSSSGPPADARQFAHSVTLSGHAGAVYTVEFAPSGQLLASGSYDKTVRCWAVEPGMEPAESLCLSKHTHNVSSLCWSADSTRLLSGSYDHTVRMWDIDTAQSSRCWFAPDAAFVQSVAYHPSSPHIFAAATTGHSLLIFDARTSGDKPAALLLNGTMVNAVSFLPNGGERASAHANTHTHTAFRTPSLLICSHILSPFSLLCTQSTASPATRRARSRRGTCAHEAARAVSTRATHASRSRISLSPIRCRTAAALQTPTIRMATAARVAPSRTMASCRRATTAVS